MADSDGKAKIKEYIPAVVVEWLDYYAMWAAEHPKDFLVSGIIMHLLMVSTYLHYIRINT